MSSLRSPLFEVVENFAVTLHGIAPVAGLQQENRSRKDDAVNRDASTKLKLPAGTQSRRAGVPTRRGTGAVHFGQDLVHDRPDRAGARAALRTAAGASIDLGGGARAIWARRDTVPDLTVREDITGADDHGSLFRMIKNYSVFKYLPCHDARCNSSVVRVTAYWQLEGLHREKAGADAHWCERLVSSPRVQVPRHHLKGTSEPRGRRAIDHASKFAASRSAKPLSRLRWSKIGNAGAGTFPSVSKSPFTDFECNLLLWNFE